LLHKFHQLHFCVVLFKLVFISHCYHESHRGELFLKHNVVKSYFNMVHECDRWTDSQTDRNTTTIVASHDMR